jgi:phage terminase large subunit-like protein
MTLKPTRFTPPLSEDFKADIDYLIYNPDTGERPGGLDNLWTKANGSKFKFDDWQIDLLRAITELTPEGNLRWRSCLISVPRQNGKTELVSALSVWALQREDNAFNISIAHSAEQARLVYDRVRRIISSNPALDRQITKLTDTRGIRHANGTRYEIKAAKADTLQGIPISVAIIDEVHLVDANAWDALVSGTGSRPNTLLVGITTAGNEDSELLKRLYDTADKAIAGELKSFGAWIWESSETLVPEDEDELIRLLLESNPALESGRMDREILLQDLELLPKEDIVRYRFNRFVNSSNKTFIPLELWHKNERGIDDVFPNGEVVFAIDMTPKWTHASVAVAVKVDDVIHTELVVSIVQPSMEKLINIAHQLMQHTPRAIYMDARTLKDLYTELDLRGFPVKLLHTGDLANASAMFYTRLASQTLKHAPDTLLTNQIPRTVRKVLSDGYTISRKDSSVEIDSVVATVMACHAVETLQEVALQVF